MSVEAGGGIGAAERRKHLRKPLRGNAQLLLAGHPPQVVRTVNLALGGMSILALTNLPLKAQCTLRFDLPLKGGGFKPIEVDATVLHGIYSGSEGGFIKIGLQFRALGVEAVSAIQNFLQG